VLRAGTARRRGTMSAGENMLEMSE
jgi:hypothetical protein